MAHGGYGKRRVSERKPSSSHRSKAPGVAAKKPKAASIKNQIRSIERLLRKDLPSEMRAAQAKKLDELKKQQDLHNRLAVERKIFLRDRKIKFFERRKIERRLRRLEKHLRSSSNQVQEKEVAQLKEDLEYVKFFPKTEKYVSLFSGDDNVDIVEKRNKLRNQIKANIIAAAASGKDLEETGSEDDGVADLSDDDFFVSGTSSDEADADDELTDISAREQASSASGKAASGLSSDERNQKQKSARSLMPPPRPHNSLTHRNFTSRNMSNHRNMNSNKRSFSNSNSQTSQSRNVSSNRTIGPSSQVRQNSQMGQTSNPSSYLQTGESSNPSSYLQTGESSNPSSYLQTGQSSNLSSNSQTGQSSNLSSNSDAPKRRRKRRPKKKKQ